MDEQEFCVVVYMDRYRSEWAVPVSWDNDLWEVLPISADKAGHWRAAEAFHVLNERRRVLNDTYSIELRPWPLEFPYVR